jgi:hypothetical protein
MDHPTDKLDALQEIVYPNIFIGTVRIGSGITDAK